MSRVSPDTMAIKRDCPEVPTTEATKSTSRTTGRFKRAWFAYERGIGKLVGLGVKGNRALGAWTARRPITSLAITLIFTTLVCCGWARFRQESSSDVLWVPQSGKARDDTLFVKRFYPRSQQGASFYAALRPDQVSAYSGNALQIPVTWEMFQLHNKVMNLSVTDTKSKAIVTFADLCYRTINGNCSKGGYLNFWGFNFSNFVDSIDGSSVDPAVGNTTAFRSQVSELKYPDGSSVSVLSIFGGTTFKFVPKFQLSTAQVIASDYTLDSGVPLATAKSWHSEFKKLMDRELPQLTYMTATYITGSSVGEELSASINGDMKLIIISLIVFFFIAVFLLSKLDSVATRTSLALMGLLVTCLGIFSGWGWGMIFGLPFTPLQQLSPFILVGMGVDVIFILVKAYDILIHREPEMTLEQAFGKVMATAGLSVQVTLIASAVAFALGAINVLPSVKWFSAYATLNTLMIMILMSTMFIAMFVLTERRISASRRDCCCCAPCARECPTHPKLVGRDASIISDNNTLESPMTVIMVKQSSANDVNKALESKTSNLHNEEQPAHKQMVQGDKKENLVKYFFRVYYAPFLSLWYVKVLVMIIFVAYAIVSFLGIYRLKYGQPLSDLAPDGSYLQQYDKMFQQTYAQQVGLPNGLYFRSVDFSEPLVQGKMMRAWDILLSNNFINASTSGFQGNWYIAFNQYVAEQGINLTQDGSCYNPLYQRATGDLAGVLNTSSVTQQINGCVPQAQYYPLLKQFLALPSNNWYQNDVIIRKDVIVTARLNTMQAASASNDKYSIDFMKSIRPLEKQLNKELFAVDGSDSNPPLFTWNSNYIFYEGDAVLPDMALEYFLLALAGVGVVMLFMLVNPWTALLMMCAIGLVDLYLFGELWILKINFNQVSVINMIMATGLAVDYSVYFVYKFMTVEGDGTLNSRMQESLTDTGSAVFLGGLTALCGTVPMAFSKSVIIRTFFKLIFGTIVFSLLVGLMLLPVVLSVVGPPAISKSVLGIEDEDHSSKEEALDGSKKKTVGDDHSMESFHIQATSESSIKVARPVAHIA